ncbi:hypothetical protein BDK61_2158 [Haloarcula quadrata]|uniref:Uncharacterized protein n=1 Tax=Haloarcula quadrata TaxID=182779 RepID=A0A495R6W4_9EURY|nr:hypothetical protein [Haloarcula quadrata]RKS82836.1 hypothetical protein BDK61_2158 [Haloarcula quadrata]
MPQIATLDIELGPFDVVEIPADSRREFDVENKRLRAYFRANDETKEYVYGEQTADESGVVDVADGSIVLGIDGKTVFVLTPKEAY